MNGGENADAWQGSKTLSNKKESSSPADKSACQYKRPTRKRTCINTQKQKKRKKKKFRVTYNLPFRA